VTDAEVIELYRALLGRAPESADTIAAFKSYYPSYEIGRLAIMRSAEFATLYQAERPALAGALALHLLARASDALAAPTPSGTAVPAPGDPTPQHSSARNAVAAPKPAWAAPLLPILRAHGDIRLAVIVGPDAAAAAMLAEAAGPLTILQVDAAAPEMPAQIARLAGGAALFRLRATPSQTVEILHATGGQIGFLQLVDFAEPWLAALRPHLAPRAILAGCLPPSILAWPQAERRLSLCGLDICFLGGWFLPVTYTPALPMPVPPTQLSLCIAVIMRNEATAIANMIASAATVATSFVVLDTGSTDQSVAMAEAALHATRKPFILRTHPGGRFDEMRNAALDLVPPGTDWVLMLDADEELVPEDHTPLLALLADTPHDALALPRYNFTGPDKSGEVTPYPDRQVRLLRVSAGLRYSGAVHETIRGAPAGLVPLDASALGQGRGGPHIHHLVRRFRSPAAEAAKQAFYREIAARYAAAQP